jgi:predicted transcriptional regulator
MNTKAGEALMIKKRAHDIMIPITKYPNIFRGLTIREAIAEFEHAYVNVDGQMSLPRALLVIDENHNLLGMVRRRDILKALEPRFMQPMPHHHQKELIDIEGDPDLVALSAGRVMKTIVAQASQKIDDIMLPADLMFTADYNDHIAKIIYVMAIKDLNLLPIMQKGKVVGVVRSVDVFHEIAHLLLEDEIT